jgi:hypothetical protein
VVFNHLLIFWREARRSGEAYQLLLELLLELDELDELVELAPGPIAVI